MPPSSCASSRRRIYFVSSPLFVQRIVFGALAGVARLLGYRAEYPYPYPTQSEPSRTAT